MQVHDNVGIEDGFFGNYITTKDGDIAFNKRGRAVFIKKCIHKIETGHQQLVLTYETNTGQSTLTIDRGELVRGSASKFLKHGIDAYEDNISYLLKTIQQQEDEVSISYQHEGLGWMDYEGRKIYRAYTAIVPEGMNLKSSYAGKFEIQPKGKLKVYLKMIKEEVIGRTPLEFALCMGVSGILVGLLSQELSYENFLCHLFNESSTGKTTASQLAVSVSSKPAFSVNSLMTTWNNTSNYQMAMLRDNRGMMVLFDESSVIGRKDITNIIYDLTAGKERSRMNKDLSLRDTSTWATSFMSTGESSLNSNTNENTGIKVRKYEFGNVQWTDDARNADAIKKCITENYGFVGITIARYLVNQKYSLVKAEYYNHVQMYLDALETKDGFSDRVAKRMGIILYSAELLHRVLKINLNKEKILAFLIEHQQNEYEEKDIAIRAYNYLIQQITINENNFRRKVTHSLIGNEELPPRGQTWGTIRDIKKGTRVVQEIVLIPKVMEDLLREGGFSEPIVVLKRLRDKKLLDCEQGKLKRKRKLDPNSRPMSVYVLLCEYENDADDKTSKRKSIEKYKASLREINNIEDVGFE